MVTNLSIFLVYKKSENNDKGSFLNLIMPAMGTVGSILIFFFFFFSVCVYVQSDDNLVRNNFKRWIGQWNRSVTFRYVWHLFNSV